MPSKALLDSLTHLTDVRQIMARAGFGHEGSALAVLTNEEVDEQILGAKAGVSAADVAEQFITRRRSAMGEATVAA